MPPFLNVGADMLTLADMKTTIADETMRDDLIATGIPREISRAIKFYMSKRFWFNEKRTRVLFNTVIGQDTYTAADQVDIPNLIRIDSITSVRDGRSVSMELVSQDVIDNWITAPSSTGDPSWYFSYYDQALRFYPVPNSVYPIRIAGVVRIAEPANDAETNNPWMNDAEELIRARAKRNIYANWMEDDASAQRMAALEAEALLSLQAESSSRTQVSRLFPDCI